MRPMRRSGLCGMVLLVACSHDPRPEVDAAVPAVPTAAPIAVTAADAVDAAGSTPPVPPAAPVCCPPQFRPRYAIEGAQCCADGAWRLDPGTGRPACGRVGMGSVCGGFDRRAAAASMGAVDVASCARPTGPRGPGHIRVTFAPRGSVESAVVDSPRDFSGTAVARCIEEKFRDRVRVSAFSGKSATVGFNFNLN